MEWACDYEKTLESESGDMWLVVVFITLLGVWILNLK